MIFKLNKPPAAWRQEWHPAFAITPVWIDNADAVVWLGWYEKREIQARHGGWITATRLKRRG